MLVVLQEVEGYFDFLTLPPFASIQVIVNEEGCSHAISGRSIGVMTVTGLV
jgi:hypothetical protein